jgi:hypothetical protein
MTEAREPQIGKIRQRRSEHTRPFSGRRHRFEPDLGILGRTRKPVGDHRQTAEEQYAPFTREPAQEGI